jgi:hypothetical protein
MIVQAFKFGTFSKIPEFMDFRARLSQSLQKTTAKALFAINQIFYICESWEQVRGVMATIVDSELLSVVSNGSLQKFFDNRDTKVIPEWTSSDTNLAEKIRSQRFPYSQNITADRITLLKVLKSWDHSKEEDLQELMTHFESSSDTTLLKSSLQVANQGTHLLLASAHGKSLDMSPLNQILSALEGIFFS